jgi:hypothetical protein
MEIITLREVLGEMEKRERPFSVTFITLDRKRKTGGDVVTIDNGMLSGSNNEKSETQKPLSLTNEIQRMTTEVYSTETRNPNHFVNRTRNIRILGTSQIRKLHIRLIIEFNCKTVFY